MCQLYTTLEQNNIRISMYLNPLTHTDNLPDSYYAATQYYRQTYPQLTGDVRTQICVIGGGFGGVNTALELAERGFEVVLLEGRKIGWGASGRNGGQLIRGIGHGTEQFKKYIGEQGMEAIDRMGFEAVDIVRERVAKYDIQCDLTMGYCDLANKPEHLEHFIEDKAWLDKMGYAHHTEVLTAERMHEVVGSDAYVGGLVDMGSGHVHPLNLVQGEAAAAASLGVKIFEQALVTKVVQGEPNVVHTATGKVTADTLVICGNAYVAGLDPVLEGKVLPAGSYVMATEPLSDEQAKRVLPQNMAVCDQKVGLDYYRLSADNRLLFGGICNYSGRDPKNIEAVLRPHLVKVFPYLADVKIDYQWGGMIGIGANRMPQIGRLKPNVYYAQAYAGHGLNATHMAAKLMAESISAESQRIEVFEKIPHITFPGGKLLRSPLLALGMLYHRLKEVM